VATVIDSLLVTLGLDPRPYQKASKDAERRQKQFKESVKKGGNEIADALSEVGRQAAVLFLGFEGLKGAISYLGGLNLATAELGRFSKNIGQSAHEVNTWDSAVELAGGTAKDAENDLRSLSGSLTALKATGEVSPLILLFQRLGVAVYDAQGRTRKLTDIYKDLGDKLGKFNRADAVNLAQQAGLSESTINLILTEAQERERLLALAEKNNAVNDESVKNAQELQQEWREIGQQTKAFGMSILADVTPAVKGLFSFMQGAFGPIKDLLTIIINGWKQLAGLIASIPLPKGGTLGGFLKDQWDIFKDDLAAGAKGLHRLATGGQAAAPTAAAPAGATRGLRNNNPGNIRYAGQASATGQDAQGFAIFPNLNTGIQEANRQLDLYAKRGINTIEAIVSKWAPKNENDTQSYIGRLEKQLGINRGAQLTPADRQRLLSAIFNQGEGNKVGMNSIASALGPNPGALDSLRFAGAATADQTRMVAQSGGGAETNIDIRDINVYTQATDANGVAAELPNALRRKGVVAQADTGQS